MSSVGAMMMASGGVVVERGDDGDFAPKCARMKAERQQEATSEGGGFSFGSEGESFHMEWCG